MTPGTAASHVLRLEAENRRLADEVHKLRSQLSAMRQINGLPDIEIFPFGLAPAPHTIFTALLARTVVSTESILTLLYSGRPGDGPTNGVRTVRVLISRMRALLKPFGIKIDNRYDQGYSFSALAKAKIHNLLNGGNHEPTQSAGDPPGATDRCAE